MYIVANDDPFVRDQILDYLLKEFGYEFKQNQ